MDGTFKPKNLDIDFLNSFDEFCHFSSFEILDNEEKVITAFVCQINNIQKLRENWMNIIDYISNDYLSNVASEFEIWNSYVLFLCEEKIPKELLYTIENDKFSVRKIVERIKSQLDESKIIQLLNRKILFTHIDYPVNEQENQTGISIRPPSLSAISQNLIDAKIPLGQRTEESKSGRDKWLLNKLEEITTNEN
jgi:hypothetical protein